MSWEWTLPGKVKDGDCVSFNHGEGAAEVVWVYPTIDGSSYVFHLKRPWSKKKAGVKVIKADQMIRFESNQYRRR